MKKFLLIFISLFIIKTTIEIESISQHKVQSFASLDLEQIRKDILNTHNEYRKKHQVGKLVRDSRIESIAQAYSEKLAAQGTLVHSKNKLDGQPLGENLYGGYGGNGPSGSAASKMWYDEVKNYNYNNPRFDMNTGHFTQLVWKESEKIGCGAACGSSMCIITCNYFPAGNFGYEPDYARNVLPYVEVDDSKPNNEENQKNQENQEKKGMSFIAKFFIILLIIILLAVAGFAVFHFVIKKRSFGEIKNYFSK